MIVIPSCVWYGPSGVGAIADQSARHTERRLTSATSRHQQVRGRRGADRGRESDTSPPNQLRDFVSFVLPPLDVAYIVTAASAAAERRQNAHPTLFKTQVGWLHVSCCDTSRTIGVIPAIASICCTLLSHVYKQLTSNSKLRETRYKLSSMISFICIIIIHHYPCGALLVQERWCITCRAYLGQWAVSMTQHRH